MSGLVVEQVVKSFGSIKVLTGVNLRVEDGERHALIGPNGSGKSTLFNVISGRMRASSGSISLDGKAIMGSTPYQLSRSGLARSFQTTHVFDNLTAFENVYLATMGRHERRWSLRRRGQSWTDIEQETNELLRRARLDHLGSHQAVNLAYSEQRALEICMTVATDPKLVLLDEPTAGMSRDETRYMVDFIKTMTEGRSLLIVEHDMDVVFGLADRISVLANGVVLATGAPDEIRNNVDVKRAYLGDFA